MRNFVVDGDDEGDVSGPATGDAWGMGRVSIPREVTLQALVLRIPRSATLGKGGCMGVLFSTPLCRDESSWTNAVPIAMRFDLAVPCAT